MTTNRTDRSHDVEKFEAALRAHIAATAATAPIAIEALTQALYDGGADMAYQLIASMMPRRVGPGLHQWLAGGPQPTPVKRLDPDSGRAPKAQGERHMMVARLAEATRRVDTCSARLAEADSKRAQCESDLEEADDRVRHVAIHRLLSEISMQNSTAAMLGPIYTLTRAVSPYLQVDEAFEQGLSPQQVEDLARRRETRPAECREILDLLDRYAGDPRLEIVLQREILKIVREHHKRFENDIEKRRADGIKSTERMKRRAIRRRSEDMKAGVHPAAPLVDAAEVIAAFEGLGEGPDTDFPGRQGTPPDGGPVDGPGDL